MTAARDGDPLDASTVLESAFEPLPMPRLALGESPMWHPVEQALYVVDIDGRAVHRFDPASGRHDAWPQPSEPAVVLPHVDGGVLVAMRDGLWRLDGKGRRHAAAEAPYDARRQRFNDGKADAAGRVWLGTIDDARAPLAALYRLDAARPRDDEARFTRVAEGLANANGLAFSCDGRTMYWADTRGHALLAFDVDPSTGALSRRRTWARFAGAETAAASGRAYRGRPDGATVDAEGAYWVAMYEGARLMRWRVDRAAALPATPQAHAEPPAGGPDVRVAAGVELLADVVLPVRRPTMPCFGGADRRSLFVTSAAGDGDALGGLVLHARTRVAGWPANCTRA